MTRLIPLLAALLLAATPLDARVRRVPQDLPTIQAAVDSSLAHGDTVLVDRGVWTEQVRIGPGRLTLASRHLFSGDTLDIEETILDGGFQRNILFAEMDTQSELVITGLTFREALAVYDIETDHSTGGGLHFETCPGHVRLHHLVFRDNRGSSGSAVRFAGSYFPFNMARFELEDINCFDNHDPRGPQYTTSGAIVINRCKTLRAKRLFVKGSTAPGTPQYGLSAEDTLEVAGVWVTGITEMIKRPVSMGAGQYGWADIRDVYFTHNHSHHPGSLLFSTGAQARMRLRNIHVEDNFYEDSRVDETSIGPELTIWAEFASLDADSLFINRNRVENCGQLLDARGSFSNAPSWIRNLEVVGNHVGSRTSRALGEYRPEWPVELSDLSLYNAHFAEDTLQSRYLGMGEYMKLAAYLRVFSNTMDTLRVRNVRMENIHYINNNDYLMEDIFSGIAGQGRTTSRTLSINSVSDSLYPLHYMELDSITLRNCRMPNIIPEVDINDMFQTWFVGSTAGVTTSSHGGYFPAATIRNITLDGCDDGGLSLRDVGYDLEVDNVAILNTQRYGLFMPYTLPGRNSHLKVRNLLVKNIQQEEFHRAWPYPLRIVEQSAIKFLLYRDPVFGQDVEFSNFSILDCDVPILIQVLDAWSQEPYVIYNSLIAGNTYDFLTPWWQEYAPTHFHHSAVQEEVMGEDNLIVDDPGFDPILGPPWLAEDSPCVDAGDPSRLFDDREDPDQPGQALWPSRGGLRNDIGYTGGPGIRPSEYLVSVPPPPSPASPERPAALVLHPAAPNPFNPVTTLSFTLERPGRTRLDLYDLRGACVRHLDERARGRGAHTFTLDATGLPSGVYIVELRQGRERTQQKVLLLK